MSVETSCPLSMFAYGRLQEYITDLEDKLRNMEDLDSSHQQILTALRADLVEEKKQSKNTSDYIASMEAAVAQSETETKTLSRKIERLEAELKRKEDIHLELQERIKLVDTTEDNQLLLRELEEKNSKMADLEQRLEETLHLSKVMGEERDDLRQITTQQARDIEVLKAWQHEQDRAQAQTNISNPPSKMVESLDTSQHREIADDDSPEKVPGSPTSPIRGQHDLLDRPIRPGSMRLAPEVVELQEKHQLTLAELATISDRYKEALEKITELTGQVVEAEQSNLHVQTQAQESAQSSPSISRSASAASDGEQTSVSPRIQRRTQSVGNDLATLSGRMDFQSGRGDRKGDARFVTLIRKFARRLNLAVLVPAGRIRCRRSYHHRDYRYPHSAVQLAFFHLLVI
jgi:chromosome segregation ATPase